MNKEDYVSLEVAKLLKEKGFDEYCKNTYSEYDNNITIASVFTRKNTELNNNCYSCPTLYEAQKWLRLKHNLYVNSLPSESIWGIKKKFTFMIDKLDNNGEWECGWEQQDDDFYATYEKALNEGILEALKLI